jgi:hypothetical protein
MFQASRPKTEVRMEHLRCVPLPLVGANCLLPLLQCSSTPLCSIERCTAKDSNLYPKLDKNVPFQLDQQCELFGIGTEEDSNFYFPVSNQVSFQLDDRYRYPILLIIATDVFRPCNFVSPTSRAVRGRIAIWLAYNGTLALAIIWTNHRQTTPDGSCCSVSKNKMPTLGGCLVAYPRATVRFNNWAIDRTPSLRNSPAR